MVSSRMLVFPGRSRLHVWRLSDLDVGTQVSRTSSSWALFGGCPASVKALSTASAAIRVQNLSQITFDQANPPPYNYNHVRVRFGEWQGRRVAVKEVSLKRAARELPSQRASERLREEARLLDLAGRHAGILNFYGLVESELRSSAASADDDDVLSLVTEECSGGTLATSPLPKSETFVISTLLQLAQAIRMLHARGIAHRDLKPQNVFVNTSQLIDSTASDNSQRARVVLGDFDHAVLLKEHSLLSDAVGTRRYMAPEVVMVSTHDSSDSDAGYDGQLADVYSFGMVAYFLLEGRQPFHEVSFAPGMGWSEADFNAAVNEKGLRPTFSLASSDRQAALQKLIEKCWVARPALRPTFVQICEALEAIKSGSPAYSSATTRVPKVGGAAERSRRPSMEDAFFCAPLGGQGAFAAVFDGHGGAEVANFAVDWLRNHKHPESFGDPEKLLRDLEHVVHQAQRVNDLSPYAGATATLVSVNEVALQVAWLGDSSAYLCRSIADDVAESPDRDRCSLPKLEIVPLTVAHQPDLPVELKRIEAAGGTVRRLKRTLDNGNEYPYGPARLYMPPGSSTEGGIALSRALGDFDLKPVLSGEPECRSLPSDPARDLFVVVASDGIWDVILPEDACVFVCQELARAAKRDPAQVAEQLVKRAIAKGSSDNVTAVIVKLRRP
eukprot:TRINITY_DN5277_c0_g1_i1.p1 TRINITY_DN5277_c0_g1~~TRINITY_DN5277_c0_g1_i1.p1  ORF type:complete len:692 (-),score=72.03 TRINITY_DN5277_c0_g1_i1:448-2457(-)